MKITTEIEWYETDVVPGYDQCEVLCAVQSGRDRKVIVAYWMSGLGDFVIFSRTGVARVEPVRWAYMPDFPEEP